LQTIGRQPVSAQDRGSYVGLDCGVQRFLISKNAEEANASLLFVVLNWASKMDE
jgi:hypothetical protein